MKYWHSLVLTCAWLVVLTIAGRGISRLLPKRQQPAARLYLGPALGLAVYVILATASGWLVGARGWLAVTVTLLISIASLCQESDWRGLGMVLGGTLAAAVPLSFGVLASIWRFGGYFVYNDAFTYLVQSEWLQDHPFRTPAVSDAFHPVWTQVAIYQGLGLRMGASFFLAWVQAASPFARAIDVYPAVAAACLVTGALAIGGVAAALAPSKRSLVFGWILAAGTALGGFSFGSVFGFLPQTCGFALVMALFALMINFRPGDRTTKPGLPLTIVPLALVFSAIGFAYSELLPFLGLTLGLWFTVSIVCDHDQARGWLAAGAEFVLLTALIWNGELRRIFRALAVQSSAVVGWPVPWSVLEFFGHAVGLRSGCGDGDAWSLPYPILAVPAMVALMLGPLVILGLFRSRPALCRRYLAPGTFMALCIAFFIYFRYQTRSPWPTGIGQSWNQFKLSNWLSPVLLAVVGAGMMAKLNRRAYRWAFLFTLAGFIGNNLYQNYLLAWPRVAELTRQTGRINDPFKTYRDLRSVIPVVVGDSPVYLDLGSKNREILAYYLHDIPTASDWSDDGSVYPWLAAGYRPGSLAEYRWWIRSALAAADGSSSFHFGAMELSLIPNLAITREDVVGGYGLESDASGWWEWSRGRLEVDFSVRSRLPARARLSFQYLGTSFPRSMTLTINQGPTVKEETISLVPGWQTWTSAPFVISNSKVSAVFFFSQVPGSACTVRPAHGRIYDKKCLVRTGH